MKPSITAQTIWQENAVTPFLIDSVLVLTFIILILFFLLFAWRLLQVQKKKVEKSRRVENEKIIFSYLNEEMSLNQVHTYLETYPQFIPGFVAVCIDLLGSLEGELESKIQNLFKLDEIRSDFQKKLNSHDMSQIVKALIFFKHCDVVSPSTVQKIESLIHHQNEDVALASALALIDSKEIEIQFSTLQNICRREDITPIAILELLLIFAETDNPDFQERGEMIMKILKSDGLPFKFRLVLIKGLGSIGFINQAPELYNLLTEYLKNEHSPNEKLVSAIVEALGKLTYQPVLPVLKQLIRTGNTAVCISCAKALASIGGEDSIVLLDLLFKHPERKVRQEAMNQLLKIGASAMDKLKAVDGAPDIEKNTLKEISEIQQYHYG